MSSFEPITELPRDGLSLVVLHASPGAGTVYMMLLCKLEEGPSFCIMSGRIKE